MLSQTNIEIRSLFEKREIYIVPVTCPEGYRNRERTVEGGVDANRSYPWPGHEEVKSASCVEALKSLYEEKKFQATLDLHASGRMWLLPWGYTYEEFSEGQKGQLLKRFSAKLAELNDFTWGPIPDMVNYLAPGSSADYFYLRGKQLGISTLSMGIELGTQKQPARSQIKVETDLNFKALLEFVKEAPDLFDGSSSTFQLSSTQEQKIDESRRAYAPSPWFTPFEE